MSYVGVAIVNYRSEKKLASLLTSLNSSSMKPRAIVVVDNNTDAVPQPIDFVNGDSDIHIEIIQPATNLGYAQGNNRAIERLLKFTDVEFVLILNPDCLVAPELIETMISNSEGQRCVMSRTFSPSHEPLYDKIELRGFKQNLTMAREQNGFVTTDYLAGSCLLLPRQILDRLEPPVFYADFFLYWEEVDLSLRLRKAGVELVSSLDSFIVRASNGAEDSLNAFYFYARNSFLLRQRHPDMFSRWALVKFMVTLICVAIVKSFKRLDPFIFLRVCRGLYDGILGQFGPKFF